MVFNHVITLHCLIWCLDSFCILEQEVTNAKKLTIDIFFRFLSHYSHILRKHAQFFTRLVRESVRNSTIHKKNSTRRNNVSSIFIILQLYEAQHVSGDTPPIIRSLKVHWQPLIFHTWKVVGRVVGGRCNWKKNSKMIFQ